MEDWRLVFSNGVSPWRSAHFCVSVVPIGHEDKPMAERRATNQVGEEQSSLRCKSRPGTSWSVSVTGMQIWVGIWDLCGYHLFPMPTATQPPLPCREAFLWKIVIFILASVCISLWIFSCSFPKASLSPLCSRIPMCDAAIEVAALMTAPWIVTYWMLSLLKFFL